MTLIRGMLVMVLLPLLAGCARLGYYAHLAHGQLKLVTAREPVAAILGDPARDPELRRRLAFALEARAYAGSALGLPDNGSYTLYVELGRPFVVWNVIAAPELSLAPRELCHPFVGCLAYQGFYDLQRAQREAARLREEGWDVHVGPVPAYSTLGWFDDPLLSSMLEHSDDVELAGTIFHELAHQQLYIAGDTAFNESFATFVEEQGVREFRAARPLPAGTDLQARRKRYIEFVAIVMAARERLQQVYSASTGADEKRRLKAAELERLRADYAGLRERWGGFDGYDAWFDAGLNNARLVPVGLYQQWVPAFAALFGECNAAWSCFYARAAALGEQPAAERAAALQALSR